MAVPLAPGIPPLLLASSLRTLTPELLTRDGIITKTTLQWGLYLNGQPVIKADTVTAFDFKREWVVADYPLEGSASNTNAAGSPTGAAFESYDKVYTPYKVRLQYVAGGDDQKRKDLLVSVDNIAADLNQYDVLIPEGLYPNGNVERYDYRRTSQNGLGLLVVNVMVTEVRIQGITGSNTFQPGSRNTVSLGLVTPSVSTSQQSITVS